MRANKFRLKYCGCAALHLHLRVLTAKLLRLFHILTILTYAVGGLPLKKQIGNLNTCWNNAYGKIFRMEKWESVRELQSLCGRYDLKTIFETKRRNFMCQLYDSSNSLVRVCYVVHNLCCISGAFLFVLSVCLCLICCTLYCSCCSCLRINVNIYRHAEIYSYY